MYLNNIFWDNVKNRSYFFMLKYLTKANK